jgi:DNA-binding LacI/PurR family transcriptional regulator
MVMAKNRVTSPKLADLAKAAGVSKGTASNVFSHPELVRDEVRRHVRQVAQAIGYAGPDPKGRLLRGGRVNAIGVATFEPLAYFFADPYARLLMQGISAALDERGAGIALVSAKNREKLAWNIESALVDGFILLCIEGGPELVQLTQARQLPFVALALGKTDELISALGVDDAQGARLAAAHMIGLGHRRFAILGTDFNDDGSGLRTRAEGEAAQYLTPRDRLRGYFEVLAANGIDPDSVPIYETRNDPETVEGALDVFFKRTEPPTALLCMSDRVALFALDGLKRRGLRVPEDVSVVGFDGVPEAAAAFPPLTTVAQPIEAMGRRAVDIIFEGRGAVHKEVFNVELVVRGSTAPPQNREMDR